MRFGSEKQEGRSGQWNVGGMRAQGSGPSPGTSQGLTKSILHVVTTVQDDARLSRLLKR